MCNTELVTVHTEIGDISVNYAQTFKTDFFERIGNTIAMLVYGDKGLLVEVKTDTSTSTKKGLAIVTNECETKEIAFWTQF